MKIFWGLLDSLAEITNHLRRPIYHSMIVLGCVSVFIPCSSLFYLFFVLFIESVCFYNLETLVGKNRDDEENTSSVSVS